MRLPATIAREAGLRDNQTVELKVLAERLAAYAPMPEERTEAMAWDPIGAEAIE